MPRHPTNTKPATMIEEVAIELDAASGSADEAAGHACMCPPRPKSENLPTTSQHQPRRGRRTKPRRNTSITSASTSDVTSDFDLDTFSDSLSTVGDKDNKDTMALSTEVSDDLYFDEIEKLLDDTENTTNANPAPTVSIAAKMQARLLAKHIKTHRLRRVVSHSAATSLQDDVDMLNEASGTGTSSNSTRTGKMRTVFSFGDLRHHDEAEEHQVLTDRILDNILEDDEEDANVVPSPNDVFEDFDIASEDKSHIKDHHQQPQQQATLKPHPKSMSTCMTPTTVLNDSIGSGSSSRIGYTPFFPPPQPGGLRRAKTSAATYAASAAGRAMLASSNENPSSKMLQKQQVPVIGSSLPLPPKPNAAGQRLLRRAKTDSLTHCGGASSDQNSRKIKEVTVEDFYCLLRLHQSQNL